MQCKVIKNITAHNIPRDLINDVNKNRLLIFVGSGISCNSGLPSWEELLNKLSENHLNHIAQKQREYIKRMIENGHMLEAAEYIKYHCTNLYRAISEIIYKKPENLDIQNMVWKVSPKGLITSNYDTLLEESFIKKEGNYLADLFVATYGSNDILQQIPSGEKPFILKIHGSITDMANELIFGESSYYKLMSENELVWECLSELFKNNTILFLGYGIRDIDIKLFFAKFNYKFQGIKNRPYILL